MSTITLSKAVRSNLLNLQSTADLLAKSQSRLASGLRVNSALDNPTNFFTAQNLNSRAGDLTQLMDSISSAIKTVQAADDGITAISKLVESAQATARQALQTATHVGGSGTPATTSSANLSGLTIYDVGAAEGASVVGIAVPDDTAVMTSLGITDGMMLTYTIGAESYTFEFDYNGSNTGTADDVHTNDIDIAIYGNDQEDWATNARPGFAAAGFEITTNGGNWVVELTSNTTDNLVISGTAAVALGIAGTHGPRPNVTSGNETAGSVTINGQTVNLAEGDDVAAILGKFQTAAGNSSGTDEFTVSNAGGVLTFTGVNGNDLDISGDANTLAALGLSDTTIDGVAPGAINPRRAELVSTYNDLLTQITAIAKDSGFNGVNLLNGDDLSVLFNEDGSSKLTIEGETNSATALGLANLASTAFDTNTGINGVLGSLKDAIDTLRVQAGKLGSKLSVIETRQTFTNSMISVLETGASNLTLADANDESANVLALQTRQQLSSTALSLASQADQNVLRLF